MEKLAWPFPRGNSPLQLAAVHLSCLGIRPKPHTFTAMSDVRIILLVVHTLTLFMVCRILQRNPLYNTASIVPYIIKSRITSEKRISGRKKHLNMAVVIFLSDDSHIIGVLARRFGEIIPLNEMVKCH